MDKSLVAIRDDSMRNLSVSLREWWWSLEEPLLAISDCLVRDRYVVIDDFIPRHDARVLAEQVKSSEEHGLLQQPGLIGGGRLGKDLDTKALDSTIRGDSIGYFDGDEQIWLKRDSGASTNQILLKTVLEKMNTLVCELRDLKQSPADPSTFKSKSRADVEVSVRRLRAIQAVKSELFSINSRSRAMISCYKGVSNAFYSSHYDNANKNGRKLTSILYLNENWTEDNGGVLFIHPPRTATGDATVATPLLSSSAKIVPILGRLVMFWSDLRCPHEVSPVTAVDKSRFAITLWFIDSVEKRNALAAQSLQVDGTDDSKANPPPPSATPKTALDFANTSTSPPSTLTTPMISTIDITKATTTDEAISQGSVSYSEKTENNFLNTTVSQEDFDSDHLSWTVVDSSLDQKCIHIYVKFKSASLWDQRSQIMLDVSENAVKVSIPSNYLNLQTNCESSDVSAPSSMTPSPSLLFQVDNKKESTFFLSSSVAAKFVKNTKQMSIKVDIG